MQRAAVRALGSRTRLRMLAISLWAGFLGALPFMLVLIAALPDAALPAFGFGAFSVFFLSSWMCAFIAASIGVLLSHPRAAPPLPHGPSHGR